MNDLEILLTAIRSFARFLATGVWHDQRLCNAEDNLRPCGVKLMGSYTFPANARASTAWVNASVRFLAAATSRSMASARVKRAPTRRTILIL